MKRNNNGNHRKNVNEDYFEIIDTNNKAYWLGFLHLIREKASLL